MLFSLVNEAMANDKGEGTPTAQQSNSPQSDNDTRTEDTKTFYVDKSTQTDEMMDKFVSFIVVFILDLFFFKIIF